jgi:hypothetical protein
VQVRAWAGEAGAAARTDERGDDRAVVRGWRAGAAAALRVRANGGARHGRVRGRHARRAALLRLRQGPLHWGPAIPQRSADHRRRRACLRRRLRHGQGRAVHLMIKPSGWTLLLIQYVYRTRILQEEEEWKTNKRMQQLCICCCGSCADSMCSEPVLVV